MLCPFAANLTDATSQLPEERMAASRGEVREGHGAQGGSEGTGRGGIEEVMVDRGSVACFPFAVRIPSAPVLAPSFVVRAESNRNRPSLDFREREQSL